MTNRIRAHTTATHTEPETTTSLFGLLRLLLTRRNLIATVVGTVAVVTAIILLLIPNWYTSTASILPSGGSDRMSELKSLAGLSGMMSTDESSSDLFPDILGSQAVRDEVLDHTYTLADGTPITLSDYFGTDDPDKLRRALAHISTVTKDRKTGVIRISVDTDTPELSQAIVKAYLDELEYFNRHKRTSRAAEKAAYLEMQLEHRNEQMQAAEDSLEQYQMSNRDWAASSNPELVMSLARLQRSVEIHSKAYMYLRQEYEIARLDAQKDIPIIQILDNPTLPSMKAGPMRTTTLFMVVIITALLTLTGTVLYEWLSHRARTVESDSFTQLREEVDRAAEPLRKITLRLKGENAASDIRS